MLGATRPPPSLVHPAQSGARGPRVRDRSLYPSGVLFLIGVLLAIFVLPSPWGLVAVATGAILDIAETGAFLWWSKRRSASVGVGSLVGKRGVAVDALWPEGQVKLAGEIWKARCEGGCERGTAVVVREVQGLTLIVDPA